MKDKIIAAAKDNLEKIQKERDDKAQELIVVDTRWFKDRNWNQKKERLRLSYLKVRLQKLFWSEFK